MSKYTYGRGLIPLEGSRGSKGTEKLGVSWGTVAVPDYEFSDRRYACVHDVVDPPVGYRTIPLIDAVYLPGSAHEGQLSGHMLVEAGITVVTRVHLNVMGPRGRLTVKRQLVQDFETFRDLLDKRTVQLRAGGDDLFKAFEVQACVSVVTQVHLNVMRPRGLPTAQCREAQDFKTFCYLLASAGMGLLARLVCVLMDKIGNALRGKNDPADDAANIDPTESGAPMPICDRAEQFLTKPMTAINMRQPQVVHDVVELPVGCRNLPLIDTLHPLGTAHEGKLSGYFLAYVSVANASRGKNDPADEVANIDPTESGAPLAICDQVDPLAKPMTTIDCSRSTPDLVANIAAMPAPRLKVAALFVGALVLIILLSTFARGMIAAVRNLLVVVITSSALYLRSVSCAMPVTRYRFEIPCVCA
eukprot:SAG11_NODE_39_length_21630_cov_11.188658_15_plen_416_part_00